jgi:glyoxylase-like metal-dependent hydrolase (beta-lactamase superfamily II)
MGENQTISLDFFASGYCESHGKVANPKFGKGTEKFYATWALIYLPETGYVLFDTGYTEHFQTATAPFPDRFYRWMTPVFIKKNETARAILAQKGISEKDIKYVIVSHFHADHIAGLKDFPSATFICSEAALTEVKALKGIKAVKKGILHALFPVDFYERVRTIEDFSDKITVSKEGLTTYFLFKNEQFKLVAVHGHAKGMLGFIFDTDNKKIFFGTDASWSYDTYNQGILPFKIVKLFFDSWKDFVETQQKIRTFQDQNPMFTILFTHCVKTLNHISNEI